MSKQKKVTYLLIYEKCFYDENVGFTKLMKVLKPRISLLSSLGKWIHMYMTLNQL